MAVKNNEQYEALKDKGMSKQRAAKIANTGRHHRAEEGRRPQGREGRRQEAVSR
jgi:hypothetical protein